MSGLISPAYREEQARLHADPRGYGGRGRKWADLVIEVAKRHGFCQSILDYGCGQGSLGVVLRAKGWDVREYDPAIPGKDGPPAPADLVVCTDVMEHVEPVSVQPVIRDLRRLARRAALVVVSLVPTAKTLADGRQAHISLHAVETWRAWFGASFHLAAEYAIKSDKQWVAVLTPRTS